MLAAAEFVSSARPFGAFTGELHPSNVGSVGSDVCGAPRAPGHHDGYMVVGRRLSPQHTEQARRIDIRQVNVSAP